MSLFGSLSAGSSAVKSYGQAMTVVGSNIANVNTNAYKANKVAFQDILASDFKQGTVDAQLGKGVTIANIDADFSQGSFEETQSDTDMAISGNGFFTVRNAAGKDQYTRVGHFTFDGDGFLATDEGLRVMTRQLDPITKEPAGPLSGLNVLGVVEPPKKTGDGISSPGIKVAANLDSKAPLREVPFDPTDVKDSMVNFTTSVTVFDELGDEHTAVVAFKRRPDIPAQTGPNGEQIPEIRNQWEWYLLFDGSDLGTQPGKLQAVGGGFLQFDTEGQLLQGLNGQFVAQSAGVDPATGLPLPPTGPPVLQPMPLNQEAGVPQAQVSFKGGAAQTIAVNLGLGSNPANPADERTGLEGVTQFAASSRLMRIEADGNPSGALSNMSVTQEGTIMGYFDKGFTRELGQLALTKFDNPQKLVKNGHNLFESSTKAGNKAVGRGGKDGFGAVYGQTLEQSNVDLAAEFVSMMELQRGYQANTKTITTADEMVQDLINIKR